MSDPQRCPKCPKVFLWGVDEDSKLVDIEKRPGCNTNAYWKLQAHIDKTHPEARNMRCGRRGPFVHNTAFESDGQTPDFFYDRAGTSACTYCGSLSPDELFREIEKGTEITPTDKNYKIYVGSSRKFYFQHLDTDDLKMKFIGLFNAKKIRFAYPGHFYVWPYFMVPIKPPTDKTQIN